MCIQNLDISIQPNYGRLFAHHVIVTDFAFTCNGRVTGVKARFNIGSGYDLPVFQVWHPVLPGSSVYSIVGQVQFQFGNGIITVLLTGNDQIEFQSGDVVAYYQPNDSSNYMRYIADKPIQNPTYILHGQSITNATTIDTNSTDFSKVQDLPLINITTGKHNYMLW